MENAEAVSEPSAAETPAEEVQAEAIPAEETPAATEVQAQAEQTAATEPAAEPEPVVEASAEPMAEPVAAPAYPADMVIVSVDPASAKQAPVGFSHAKHEATDCSVCHHKGGDKPCASAGCHTDTTAKKIEAGQTENVSFEAAFHKGDRSCVGCHRARKSGPTKCTECHPK